MKEYDFDASINHQLATTANSLRRITFKLITEKGLDITPEQWVVLYYLWTENGLSLGMLSEKSKKDFANVSRIVDKLVKSGYIEKRKSQTDSRSFHVFLLPHAESIKDQVISCWQEATAILTNGIPTEKQEMLLNLFSKMDKNLSEYMNRNKGNVAENS
ncbi:MAG: MarR family transcriptional regulator [Bacteroidales bacterium]|nr:MarR family transcriptional regulator [Bacteroidales bacterium]